MRQIMLALLLMAPLVSHAEESESTSGPLFMKDLVDEGDFFETWGVGINFFTMDQDYSIKNMTLDVPTLGEIDLDPAQVQVTNKLQHYDLKLDAWVTPFLNVYGLIGRVDADTVVDIGDFQVPNLGSLPPFSLSYDGTVYGFGANLIYGTKNWFGAVNTAWTKSNLSGDYDSSVKALSVQPRLGLVKNGWTLWVGGMWLDTKEKHKGTYDLEVPGGPVIPIAFDVELKSKDKWNYATGIGYIFSPKATLIFEYGFGKRTHTLFNFTYRF